MSDTLTATVAETPATPVEGATPETAAPAASATPATPESKPAESASATDAETLRKQLESANARIHELNKENEKRRKAAEDADKQAAIEQGKFKELYEKAEAERAKIEAEKAQIERERLIDRVAAKNGLPDELRDRLRGDSEEELQADAENLAKLLAPKATLGATDGDRRGALPAGEMDDAQREYIKKKYRI